MPRTQIGTASSHLQFRSKKNGHLDSDWQGHTWYHWIMHLCHIVWIDIQSPAALVRWPSQPQNWVLPVDQFLISRFLDFKFHWVSLLNVQYVWVEVSSLAAAALSYFSRLLSQPLHWCNARQTQKSWLHPWHLYISSASWLLRDILYISSA